MQTQRIFRDNNVVGLTTLASTVNTVLHDHTKMAGMIRQSSSLASTVSSLSESSRSFDSHQSSDDKHQVSKSCHQMAYPPVEEIQFPNRKRSAISTSVQPGRPHQQSFEDDDYQTRYLCGQRDLHVLREKMHYVCEENRLLRRKLIELQKQIFHSVRSKRRVVDVNPAWSVPDSPISKPTKRHRKSVSIDGMLQTSCDNVISTVTSEELSVSSSKE